MTPFKVHGWFGIEYEKRKGGRTLVFDDFWSEAPKHIILQTNVGAMCLLSRPDAAWSLYTSGRRPRPLSRRRLIQPTNTSITMDSRSTQRACLSCSSSCTPTRRARQTKSRSKRSNNSSFRLVLPRTPDFRMSEGHNVPNGVFEGLFAAAERVSVLKPRDRFANSLIW